MFNISNLRKEKKGGWTYLKCDFEVTEIDNLFEEKTMWIAMKDENADMLTDDVYDAFVLIPLYLGMHYKQDVHIKGEISPLFYHNIKHYLMKIFDNFSDYTKMINFTVDGLKVAKKGPVDLIGTGISCGIDSFTSIYDNFIETTDENFKINSLFLLNSGTHGNYEDEKTRKLWLDRANLNKRAADELGLPMYLVDSNLHAFTHKLSEIKIGFLAIYSCILSMQRYLKRYIISSALSYDEIMNFSNLMRDVSIEEYSESYMVPLISTERIKLIIDGCQYTRAEKTEKISEWNIAKKYLNVCVHPLEGGTNCSACGKCMRTMFTLDAMGKLNNFKDVFNIETYKKNNKYHKYRFLFYEKKDPQSNSTVKYLRQHKFKLPSKIFIGIRFKIYDFYVRAKRKIKKIIQKN